MVFSIISLNNKKIEKFVKESLKELKDFFGIDLQNPLVFIVPNRKIINLLIKHKTENWLVAWANYPQNAIYLLDPKNYKKESIHIYSKEKYYARIKHELVHLFVNKICELDFVKPVWLSEGIAIYLSGQNKFKKIPNDAEFGCFLDSFGEHKDGVYKESGFAVKILIEKYGKYKFLELLKKLKTMKSKEEFNIIFQDIYGFELNYKIFNIHKNYIKNRFC